MKAERPHEEFQNMAAAYALGALDEPDARAFEDHLKAGCPDCVAEVHAFEPALTQLAIALPPVSPPPHLRDRLLSRISSEIADPGVEVGKQVWKEWEPTPDSGRWVVRGNEGDWQETGFAGVRAKNLFVDRQNQSATMLIRMEPGSRWPAHRHADTEQCYVVQGDLKVGNQSYQAGDYLCNAASSLDEETRTVGGCLLFIVSSQHDEFLA